MNLWKRGPNQWTLTWEEDRGPDGHRRRRRETFHGTKHEAEVYWRQVQQKIDDDTATVPHHYTVGAWMQYWLTEVKAATLRPTTYRSYAALITHYVEPTLGGVALAKLRAAHVQDAVAAWMTQPNQQRPGQPVSRRRVRYALTVLRQGLDTAVKWQLVSRNVAKLVDMPAPQKKEARWWTAAEAQQFLSATQGHPEWMAWALTLATGLRQGELLGLRWHDMDWASCTLTVRQILGEDGTFGPPKTAKGLRTLPLGPGLVPLLREHRRQQLEARVGQVGPYTDHDLVFARADGRPLIPARVWAHFKAAVSAAGLPEITFHDLRHSHASLLVAGKQTDPRALADRMGHVSISFTYQTYIHAGVDAQRAGAAQVVSQILPPTARP